jgi:tetratricopeptide (TPR) repeat protein
MIRFAAGYLRICRLQRSGACLICLLGIASLSFVMQAQEDHATQPIVSTPDEMPAISHEKQGDLLMVRGNYAAAIDAYQQAWPRSAMIWNKVGLAYHHLFALDEAMKDYQLALTLDPHYAEAYNNLGAVYYGKHEFSLAAKEYKRSLKYHPSAVTYCNLGTLYFAESKPKKGIRAYHSALELDPHVFNPNQLGSVEEAASREQRMAMAFYLAKVYASEGRYDDALNCLRKALSNGFNDRKQLMGDKELASLRKLPEFHQLMIEEHIQ